MSDSPTTPPAAPAPAPPALTDSAALDLIARELADAANDPNALSGVIGIVEQTGRTVKLVPGPSGLQEPVSGY